jgi:hypothetical protein
MPKLPSFEKWFPITIIEVVANGEEVLEDVISTSVPPLDYATTYWSMYAFGNRLWVASAKQHLST